MSKRSAGPTSLPAPARAALERLGADLAFARIRRHLSLRETASRLKVSVNTVRALEAGRSGVGLGILAHALALYGMLDRLAQLVDPVVDRVSLAAERRRLED